MRCFFLIFFTILICRSISAQTTTAPFPISLNPGNIYVGISYQSRIVNDQKINSWFSSQGMGAVRRSRMVELLAGGLLGNTGLFESRISTISTPSEILVLQAGVGFFSKIWIKNRSSVYAGASISYEVNKVPSINEFVPSLLRDDTARVPLHKRDQLDLRQSGIGFAPELKYVYQLGKKPSYRFSLFCSTGFQWHLLSKWRFAYEDREDPERGTSGRILISKPVIPSINRTTLFYKSGVIFKIRRN